MGVQKDTLCLCVSIASTILVHIIITELSHSRAYFVLEFNAPLRGIKKITEYKEYKYVILYTTDMISIIFFIFEYILYSIKDGALKAQKMCVNTIHFCMAHTETQSHRDSFVTQSTEKASP